MLKNGKKGYFHSKVEVGRELGNEIGQDNWSKYNSWADAFGMHHSLWNWY